MAALRWNYYFVLHSVNHRASCVCRIFPKSRLQQRSFHIRPRRPLPHNYATGRFIHRTNPHLGRRNYSSSGNQGGGAGKGGNGSSKPPGGGDGGFFKNFFKSFQKTMKGDEMQESLKSFNEEREKMQQSYVVQQAKIKLGSLTEKLGEVGAKGSEKTQEGWSVVKDTSSKVIKEAIETEVAKKGQAVGAQLAKGVQNTAEELVKTDVGLTVKKGSEIVMEDLIDDVVRESNPYKPPEKVMKRSDLASEPVREAAAKPIEPNEEAKEVVVTRQSKWKKQWEEFRENNPLSNAFYSLKTKYDESDNIVIRASRVVTDRVDDLVSGAVTQTDMAETLAEIQKIDPSFDKEEFIQQCRYEIIPSVLESFMQGNELVLKDWCHEAAFNVLSVVMKQRSEPGVKLDCKVLEVRDIDILMAKMMEQGPVMVLAFQAQQLTRKTTSKEGDTQEILESVMYVWALCRDQTIYDPRTAWRVLEFGIQSAGKMLV